MIPPSQDNSRHVSRPQKNGHAMVTKAASVSTEVAKRIETNPILMSDEHWKRLELLCDRAVKSGVLPKGIDTIPKAFIVALKGVELGLQPMYALEHVVVINGKATIDGQGMLRLIYERCPGSKVECVTPVDQQINEHEVIMSRPGHKPQHFKFTMDDAKRAGLLEKPGPWKQYPKAMLKWRAISDGARTIFPDIIGGLYMAEEMGAPVNEDGQVIDAQFKVDRTPTEQQTVESSASAGTDAKLSSGGVEVPNSATDEKTESWSGSEAQKQAIKLLFDTAKRYGWTEQNLRQHMEFQLGKVSTKELNCAELNDLIKHMEDNRKDALPEA